LFLFAGSAEKIEEGNVIENPRSVVKRLEIRRVLRDESEAVCGSEGKMDVVILSGQTYPLIGGTDHAMPSLPKKIS
jgi:hypothetical protein